MVDTDDIWQAIRDLRRRVEQLEADRHADRLETVAARSPEEAWERRAARARRELAALEEDLTALGHTEP
jgi:outer membrane murein-binding lipoprotein Lpp